MATTNFLKLVKQKQGFLISVYTTLIVQLFITFAIVYQFRNHPKLSKVTKQSFILYFLLSMGIVSLIIFVPMPSWMKLLLFTAYSIVTGAFLYNCTHLVTFQYINQALLATIGVFVATSLMAIILASIGIDLSFLGIIIAAALLSFLVATLIIFFTYKGDYKTSKLRKFMLIIGLVIFSIYLTYATNIMLQKDYQFDFINAALDLYLGFVNVFMQLFGLQN